MASLPTIVALGQRKSSVRECRAKQAPLSNRLDCRISVIRLRLRASILLGWTMGSTLRMAGTSRKFVIALVFLAAGVSGWKLLAGAPGQSDQRKSLRAAYDAGNYRDAYDGLRKLTLDPKCDPLEVGRDLEIAVRSEEHTSELQSL